MNLVLNILEFLSHWLYEFHSEQCIHQCIILEKSFFYFFHHPAAAAVIEE